MCIRDRPTVYTAGITGPGYFGKTRYDINTGTGHFGKFVRIRIPVQVQTFIPVPDTSVSSI